MKYLHFSLSSVGQLSTMDIIKPPVARETCFLTGWQWLLEEIENLRATTLAGLSP